MQVRKQYLREDVNLKRTDVGRVFINTEDI